MLNRYARTQMAYIWDEPSKFNRWVRVEAAVLRAKVALGMITVSVPEDLERQITIKVEEIERIERKTRHDVKAFLDHTSAQLPQELQPHWHDGMTSYDTQDTALGMQLAESIDLLLAGLGMLMDVINDLALVHKDTAMIGRTHGVHAEAITFGVKLAVWKDELARHANRLETFKVRAASGKISGAVGLYTLPPEVEQMVCTMLGLNPIVATQIISRDIHAEYLCLLAMIGGTIAKISIAGRLMQQTEVSELQEQFSKGQTGSSAMPHKRNPIGQENISGMARVLRGYALTGLENQETWHERDLTNSGPERIILPDASILLDYMLHRMRTTIAGWIVYPERMKKNLEMTGGLVFSQDVQSLLAKRSGLPREEAHGIVREIAQSCWDTGENFKQALLADERVTQHLAPEEIDDCFSVSDKLRYVGYVMERAGIEFP